MIRPQMLLATILFCAALPGADASAVTFRYALVVGNDTAPGTELPRLRHAEREAKNVGKSLVSIARFDKKRVIVITRPTRLKLLAGARQLAAQLEQDRSQYGAVRTLLTFFYTGHGLKGRLLLDDGPLSAETLGKVLRSFKADFTVGVFDACFSASLRANALAGKGGVEPLPGVTAFVSLPQDVLTATGTMWLHSSGSDELSFEDPVIGGVFTHFFLQALKRAPSDGPGIRIDQIWRYAQAKTVSYTTARQAPQRPRIVAQVSAQSFPYFSFPIARTARLWLGPNVDGEFVLSYAQGSLVERLTKHPGKALTAHVYPGKARLRRMKGTESASGVDVLLGSAMVRLTAAETNGTPPPGRAHKALWRKGDNTLALSADAVVPSSTWALSLGYGYRPLSDQILQPEHSVGLAARMDWSQLYLRIAARYGYSSREYDSWGYQLHVASAELELGAGWDVGRGLRLGLGGAVAVDDLIQRFTSNETRNGIAVFPQVRIGVFADLSPSVVLGTSLFLGPRWAPYSWNQQDNFWHLAGGIEAELGFAIR